MDPERSPKTLLPWPSQDDREEVLGLMATELVVLKSRVQQNHGVRRQVMIDAIEAFQDAVERMKRRFHGQ